MRTGWRIVCPDGRHRHLPYANLIDAEFDAKSYGEHGCADALTNEFSDCPGGTHTVEACTFEAPENEEV